MKRKNKKFSAELAFNQLFLKYRMGFILAGIAIIVILFSSFIFNNLNKDSAQAGVNCPATYAWNGSACVKTETLNNRECPSGWVKAGDNICQRYDNVTSYSCPNGGQLNGPYQGQSNPPSANTCVGQRTNPLNHGQTCAINSYEIANGADAVYNAGLGLCVFSQTFTAYGDRSPNDIGQTCNGGSYQLIEIRVYHFTNGGFDYPIICGYSDSGNPYKLYYQPNLSYGCEVSNSCGGLNDIVWKSASSSTSSQVVETNTTNSFCPSGWTDYSATQCQRVLTQAADNYTLDSGNVTGIGCDNTSPVENTTINCTLTVTGAPSGISYTGTVALSIDNGGGTVNCTLSGTSSTQTCPAVNVGTAGNKTATTDKGGSLGLNVQSYVTAIIAADLTNPNCTNPVTSGGTVTCSATFTANKSGTLTFTSSPDVNNDTNSTGCTTGNITPSATSISCTFTAITTVTDTTGIITVAASGGGSVSAGNVLVTALVPTTISASNISTGICTPSSVVSGSNTAVTCTYGLNGNSNNYYTPPSGGITANTPTGASDACTILNNYPSATTGATLSCANVKPGVTVSSTITVTPTGTGITNPPTNTLAVTAAPITSNDLTNPNCTNPVTSGGTVTCSATFTANKSGTISFTSSPDLNSDTNSTGCTTGNIAATATTISCTFTAISTVSDVTGAMTVAASGGGSKSAGNVLVSASIATTIGFSNLANSSDCIASKIVSIPQTYSCNFKLSGDTYNKYGLPTGGINAHTATNSTGTTAMSSSISDACTIVSNIDPLAYLKCDGIDTTGGSEGLKNVLLSINNANFTDKGDVTLFDPASDKDGDGISNGIECSVAGTNCPDTDNDTLPDYNDPDSDGDGIPDIIEKGSSCASITNCSPANSDNDTTPDYRDTDSDNDGIPDSIEGRDNSGNPTGTVTDPIDTDNDTTPDYRDTDSDNDTLLDSDEKGATCASITACVPKDTDNNGIPDYRQAVINLAQHITRSTDCTNSTLVTIPNTYSCNFKLKNNLYNSYQLPDNGIKAFTATDSTGTTPLSGSASDSCRIVNNNSAQATLRCENIKTTGASAGQKNVLLSSSPTAVSSINSESIWNLMSINVNAQSTPVYYDLGDVVLITPEVVRSGGVIVAGVLGVSIFAIGATAAYYYTRRRHMKIDVIKKQR